MNIVRHLLIVFLFLSLSACSKRGEGEQGNEPAARGADGSAANVSSKAPDKPWYVSDFFRRAQQWDPEASVDPNKLPLGMYELTQYPYQEATQAQSEAEDRLVNDSFDAAERHGWFSKEKGLSDGYEKMFGDPVHYVNKEYVYDGETLNPDKPEVLMYYETNQGDFLMGVMFLAVGERGPQVAGPLSKWHYHIDRHMCYEQGVLPIARTDDAGICEKGVQKLKSPEMLHVWFFDHPEGRLATRMGLTEDLLRFGIKQIREVRQEQP